MIFFIKNNCYICNPVKSGILTKKEKLVFNYANNSTISKNRKNSDH